VAYLVRAERVVLRRHLSPFRRLMLYKLNWTLTKQQNIKGIKPIASLIILLALVVVVVVVMDDEDAGRSPFDMRVMNQPGLEAREGNSGSSMCFTILCLGI
jgi:hypothetical protein